MEELQGELSSVNEEAASLNIAINQLDSSTLDLARTQVSMATKIKELNTRKSSLEKQIGILEIQLQELSLTAPISGVVVGKNLTQQLAARPVSRGVALFKVVDLEGPWHLRLQVNERDILYALGDLRDSSLPPAATNKVEFSFDRSPKDKYTAEVYRLADRVENIHGDGNFAEVLANPLAESHSSGYSGTGVHAYFDCGEYPTWFVWGRPIVEALQRRFWLPSSVADQRSNPIGKSS